MPGPNVMQRGWFGLRLQDGAPARDISFVKDLIVPTLTAGGFNVRPGEFRIFARNVVVLFQSESKRRRATHVFTHWRARGINGLHRKVYWDKLDNGETAEQDESEESEDGEAKEEDVKQEDVNEEDVKQEDVNGEDVKEEGS